MALSFLLTAFGIAATAASFVGGVAPASVPRSCLTRPAVAGRCVSPLLKEPNDDAMGPDMPGDESQWSSADDAALAEYARACSASAARCGRPQEVLREFSAAWVLIFNLGKSNEGVYTLQGRGSTNAYVLAFESMYDADRFSQLLQAENFDLPTPLRWNTPQLSDFCTAGEFEVSLVPQVRHPPSATPIVAPPRSRARRTACTSRHATTLRNPSLLRTRVSAHGTCQRSLSRGQRM